MLAARVCKLDGWNEEIVNKIELDPLRRYVQYNEGPHWPTPYRTLYPVDAVFTEKGTVYEVLHEFDLLYTDTKELYVVIALHGVEFVLNMGGRETHGYHRWLEENDGRSPLYPATVA